MLGTECAIHDRNRPEPNTDWIKNYDENKQQWFNVWNAK